MARSSLIPGFRFHPTDVELVMYYLKRKLLGKKIITNAVTEVNIYDFSPWDLPDKSSLKSGDLEWFFFCPKARKYSSGSRSNRATETGFWKATGKERMVKYKERTVAMIRTLVFHLGNAPKGERTDWVMHEYSMKDEQLANAEIIQDAYVLCKIFQKSGAGPKNGAQYGAPFKEEEWDDDMASCSEPQAVIGSDGTTNTQDYKQKGPATISLTVPQSAHSLSITEPGSSTVMAFANETTNTLDYKQKGPATMNMMVPQSTQHSLSLTKPGSSTVTFSANERHVGVPANDNVLLLEDIDEVRLFEELAKIMGVSTNDHNGNDINEQQQQHQEEEEDGVVEEGNEESRIFDDLVELIKLDDLSGDASNKLKTDDLMRDFYVD